VSRDGRRFLILGTPLNARTPSVPITVVLNWTILLDRK
jgi:hypothetical protein